MIRFLCILIAAVYAANADQQFAQAANSFAAEIYQETIEGKDGNVMISPASIQSALALTMFGATGQTQAEMMRGLKFSAEYSTNAVSNGFKAFNDYVARTDGLKIANKIFIMTGFTVKPSFQEVAKKSFYSEAQSLNFGEAEDAAKVINTWVEEQTDHYIKDLLDKSQLSSDTRMVLTNAIYFKGSWEKPFETYKTYKAPFYHSANEFKETDFMRKNEDTFKYGIFGNLDAAAVELPYRGTDITMMIILPNTRTGLSSLEKKLPSIDFVEMSNSMKYKDVNLKIPKFKFEFEAKELVDTLKKMGMKRMFTSEAEFGGMLNRTGALQVDDVVHKAFIEVDEAGTKAAAATAVLMVSESSIHMHFSTDFIADHPFLFVLKSPTSTLFIGRVVEF